jgi:hypothetical protein
MPRRSRLARQEHAITCKGFYMTVNAIDGNAFSRQVQEIIAWACQ